MTAAACSARSPCCRFASSMACSICTRGSARSSKSCEKERDRVMPGAKDQPEHVIALLFQSVPVSEWTEVRPSSSVSTIGGAQACPARTRGHRPSATSGLASLSATISASRATRPSRPSTDPSIRASSSSRVLLEPVRTRAGSSESRHDAGLISEASQRCDAGFGLDGDGGAALRDGWLTARSGAAP